MRKATIDDVPDDHRRCRGPIEGETEDGVRFRLDVRTGPRRVSSSGLVRNHIRAMTRGRTLSTSDLYEDVTEITLYVVGRRRFDIEVAPSGYYRHGRLLERSLRDLAGRILDEFSPSSAPPRP